MVTAAQRTVLVVDDEPTIRELLADVLRDNGYDVIEAKDGAAAIHALDHYGLPAHHLCGVLLDMMLPEVDGLGVLRHLASVGASVPVVAVSANRSSLGAAVAASARSALPKPFDGDALLATVTRLCKAHAD